MRKLIWIVAFGITAISALAPAYAEIRVSKEDATKPYLFDVTKKDPAIRKALTALFKGEKLPDWTAEILSGGNYVAGTQRVVEAPIAGAFVYDACMPHDCFDNRLEILITADKTRAFGLLKEDGKSRFLGKPDQDVGAILKSVQPQ
ncbi:inhibitor of vertebrate lysozyme family protein [Rhizobium sp. XQZ8]|uniref:Ivy family c-type lysozyme inhibitor n=1 Tax=Rhizobium populisoli TaxID=2859785 RepID=UPI001CA4AD2E|nr:Ivy family c-type lysozyme inhibitor [Rhizobium populisoli]MBW6422944.1 inhibitor of vertebrate lysozyme family protein [Rhizobium populisoli]